MHFGVKLPKSGENRPDFGMSPTYGLDSYNGLLLSPHLDACFDGGFVSFDDAGGIMISSKLSEEDLKVLGLHRQMRLSESKIDPKHRKYLAYHCDHVYLGDQRQI